MKQDVRRNMGSTQKTMMSLRRRFVLGAMMVMCVLLLFRETHILRVDGKNSSTTVQITRNELTATKKSEKSDNGHSSTIPKSDYIQSAKFDRPKRQRPPQPDNDDDVDPDPCAGKAELLAILQEANVTTAFHSSPDNEELCHRLPTWKSVTDLYGEKPIIIGLETCQQYKSIINKQGDMHSIDFESGSHPPAPRIGGLYNTGTNALAWYFLENIEDIGKKDLLGQLHPYELPWGKHTSAIHRLNVTFPPNTTDILPPYVLPIILVRDPYRWMQSMCKRPYFAKWRGTGHCPNLIEEGSATTATGGKSRQPVRVQLSPPPLDGQVETYESLADLWSVWNRQYFDADYPRLMIRFEDLLFHTKEVIGEIVACTGITPLYDIDETGTTTTSNKNDNQDPLARTPKPRIHKFRYHTDAAKGHGISTDMISAMSKYGKDRGRSRGYYLDDLVYAQNSLDKELIKLFHYTHPQPSMKPVEYL